jgi:hypothetical protein
MGKTSVEYGPKVLALMSLKLARLAYVAGGKTADGAYAILDDERNSEVHEEFTMYSCKWVLGIIRKCRIIPECAGKTDEELAQQIMDIIGMDPTSPCQCCGEYH